ncbi:hypothetical protein GN244_ATG20942 [Phytophthora infestans]|uniref:Uncharacterized protein n=1 Tax=Phytophthora infestans TaxID=4787 RepID=A0A833SI69_PHYIN|nr:hypothetical protein GN244_ATG20942 [Phytophthora infestans]
MPTATAKAPTITAYNDTTAAAVSSSTLALKVMVHFKVSIVLCSKQIETNFYHRDQYCVAISKMRRYFYDHVQHQPFRWMIGQTARFAQDVGRT